MSGLSRLDYQVRHYRDLAQIALERASAHRLKRSEYLALSEQWTALADQLEKSAQVETSFAGMA